ncbi:MAG: carbohydrate ABC transporter permease [Clostridiales bacterium]|jgi:putative aldouronate transport system permease protein|nr:carbohydrate ABC transporter permease [Clostridiales bacterium]
MANTATASAARRPGGERIYTNNALIGAVLILFAIVTFIPFYYAIMASLSDPKLVSEGELLLYPRGFSIAAFRRILENSRFLICFKNTVLRTLIGTAVNLTVQSSIAYSLSRKYLPGRKFFMLFIIFSMMFNPGIIPTYLVVKATGIINSLAALIIPAAISTWNIILLRNFFEAIPESIEESAKMDGANDIRILVSIVLPLSLPSLATIGLFAAVMHWNSFMDAVIYVTSQDKHVLQVFLRDMIVQLQNAYMFGDPLSMTDVSSLSLRTASVVVSTIPIVAVYPFIQRHFVRGIMVGAVKG